MGRGLAECLGGSMVMRIMKIFHDKRVSTVVIDYPKNIARNHDNKLIINFWKYRYIIN
jgi:hypothetical protein